MASGISRLENHPTLDRYCYVLCKGMYLVTVIDYLLVT